MRAAADALSPARRGPPKGDRAPPAEHFRMDPATAVQLLREHWRHLNGLAGRSGRWAKPGAPPKRWSFDEAIALLDKKLCALGLRHGIPAEPEAGDERPEPGPGA